MSTRKLVWFSSAQHQPWQPNYATMPSRFIAKLGPSIPTMCALWLIASSG